MERPTLPISAKRILVVEDQPDLRALLTRMLEIEGYFVFQACDGESALQVLRKFLPDLILSDYHMPNMNGLDFYQAVRSNPRWLTLPFIFLTSERSEAARVRRELGVEDCLLKPVDGTELLKAVNSRLLRTAEVRVAYMDRAYLETVNVLANTIEGRDPYTHGHVERVTRFALWLAEALEWPESHLRQLEFGARLHDIGKIVVPDHILNKKGPLTTEEWEVMKSHPEAGAKILRDISHLQISLSYVLHHHERWDGSGYPHALKGREIPIEGRLLALADVYDALTTARPYHPPRPHAEVIKYLRLRSGTFFDPDLTELFIHTLEHKLRLVS